MYLPMDGNRRHFVSYFHLPFTNPGGAAFRIYFKLKKLKKIILCTAIVLTVVSCNNDKKTIVAGTFIDSLFTHYAAPPAIKANEIDLQFWKNRIDPKNPGITNETKYAAALARRFHLMGDIRDIISSDSVLHQIDSVYAHKEASPLLALTGHCILQHRFKEAGQYFEQARAIGLKNYESVTTTFDVDFELGRYLLAEAGLKSIKAGNDYGYNFRHSKLAHYKGDIDTAIADMKKAAEIAGNDIALKQAALSNVADLYLHSGNLGEAYDNYVASIRLDAADLHSIMGLGWIALQHDQNDSLAEKIFRFVQSRTKAPDPLFKLVQAAEARGDSALQTKYARAFEKQVTDTVYGNMYNKYRIELYTGILHEPAKAEPLALKELSNRNTPQTQAWYTWALFFNGKKEEAYKNFQQFVSGKPLEGLELYWMGKLMQGLNKGYNAKQFFKAAYKNRYDLSPGKVKDLEKELE